MKRDLTEGQILEEKATEAPSTEDLDMYTEAEGIREVFIRGARSARED